MNKKLTIAFIASECHPFVKTGGLADVVGALPVALKEEGHNPIIILPKYSTVDVQKYGLEKHWDSMGVWMGNNLEWCSVWKTTTYGHIPVYFIEFDKYFNREGLYCDSHMNDYLDNADRFCFFTRAALQFCIDSEIKVDIFNFHDWQTAAGSCYIKKWHWNNPFIGNASCMLTIHNIGYQGKYKIDNYDYLGLGWENFHSDSFEEFGSINLLKGGIYFADLVNTVSPTYALETKSSEGGWGMAPYLHQKKDRYLGILNGVDYNIWNPEVDNSLPQKYSVNELSGKNICKKELQSRFYLNVDENVPIIGIISRFAIQKGLYNFAEVVERIIEDMHVQIVILGSGEKDLEGYFGYLPAKYQGKVGSYIGYHNELSHLIEAGSDFFLMPSIYEPCGLNQIYSLKYGTLPIVRATGGLDDTVEQYNEKNGEGTGFKFNDITSDAIYYTVGWAVSTYYDRREHFIKMQKTAMNKDFSWAKSAKEYINAYMKILK